ncbi:MAG: DUF559 domain-containing protein [Candidatus Aminicenantes bacterium]|nr:DUF559 domain-containing protein [Candidatus Aminicenantes bacterium]
MMYTRDLLREHLQDRSKTDQLVSFFVNKAVEEQKLELAKSPENADFIRFYEMQMQESAQQNVKVIFAQAESPIELAFLNSLHLCFIKAAPLNVYFRPSANNHLAFMEQHIAFYGAICQRYAEFHDRNPDAGLDDFIRKAQSVYEATESHSMPPALCEDIKTYLIFARVFVHNYFHLTIQAKLPTIKHNGRGMRTDLFIWVPTDSSLKIAIECDGYKYHSNPESFTKDRQRDRILNANGIQVQRFSGHEIHHNPQGVASELFDQLTKIAEERNLGPNA